jgi:hypothetical protein
MSRRVPSRACVSSSPGLDLPGDPLNHPPFGSARMARELEELQESRLCVVCRETAIQARGPHPHPPQLGGPVIPWPCPLTRPCDGLQVIIQPCSHACLCAECGRNIQGRGDLCPMCRGPISEISTIYVS